MDHVYLQASVSVSNKDENGVQDSALKTKSY